MENRYKLKFTLSDGTQIDAGELVVPPGKDGSTPIKGIDYFTDTDKEDFIRTVLETLNESKVLGYVDDQNNIIIQNNLSNGNYYIKYELEDGSLISIGKLILGNDSGGSVTIISFLINGKSYQAEKGMTWGEWVMSGYNTGGVRINGTAVYTAEGVFLGVYNTDVIVSGRNYIATYTPSGPTMISFTIDGDNYVAEAGMTWGEWVMSGYNTGNIYINGIAVYNVDGVFLGVYNTDVIVSGRNYGTTPSPEEPSSSTLTINGTTYTVPVGITYWGEWIETGYAPTNVVSTGGMIMFGENDPIHASDGSFVYNETPIIANGTYHSASYSQGGGGDQTIVNQIPLSTDANGNLFNGSQGWKTGYRLSLSSGYETSLEGYETTGFIPCTKDDVIRLKNITIIDDNFTNLACYDSAKQPVAVSGTNRGTSIYYMFISPCGTDEGNGVYASKLSDIDFLTNLDRVAYIRLSASEITNNSIVTINQPINKQDPDTPIIPEPSMISFTINGKSYESEENMTWGQWIMSGYNTSGCYIKNITVMVGDNRPLLLNGVNVVNTDKVKANASYTYQEGPAMISFTIDGREYQAEEGMIWDSWCSSKYNPDEQYRVYDDQSVYEYEDNLVEDYNHATKFSSYVWSEEDVDYIKCGQLIVSGASYITKEKIPENTFSVNGTFYEYSVGMTWGEFIESYYHTYSKLGLEIVNTTVMVWDNTPLLLNGKNVLNTDKIVQGGNYTYPIIQFTIDYDGFDGVRTYQAIDGMTWSDWVHSSFNVDGYYIIDEKYPPEDVDEYYVKQDQVQHENDDTVAVRYPYDHPNHDGDFGYVRADHIIYSVDYGCTSW